MKTYLAAAYGRRAEIKRYADALKDERFPFRWGSRYDHERFEINSSWLDKFDPAESAAEKLAWAIKDMVELSGSELLIVFSNPPETDASSGGRHVETGIAIAKNIQIILIGPRENVFHYGPWISARFDTWEDFFETIKPA